ncbi:diaminopimelate epimerase [Armatimonas rosea]|uniref:Diaminopimelate epimerase n=1 Tax=Armatimonas rosea TaxID=685828 RepID=A0A7W9SU83_ARMRO|nr:diaminopimelate epimerase [Armatimonas rosea]
MIAFTKMQAIGNDFVVIEEPENIDLSALAAKVCDRRFGIGADGMLTYKANPPASPFVPLSEAPSLAAREGWGGFRFRIFNADGSEDTMCGNGLRCVVRLATERGQVPLTGIAQTASGEVPYAIDGTQITLTLPPPRFDCDSIPLDLIAWGERFRTLFDGRNLMPVPVAGGSFALSAVNTGSTHSVTFRSNLPSDEEFLSWSPRVENSPAFPEKTSLMWATVSGSNALKLRIWERGVGETLGCGTGACAAAVLAIVEGKASPVFPVEVTSKGGTVQVRWDGDERSPILLIGSANTIYSGTLDSFL